MRGQRKAEVFLYSDEAGFMKDGRDWVGLERPDYQSPEALIDALERALNDWFVE